MIRFVFNLPFKCHRYLIEPISDTPHLKSKLTDRFLKFALSVKNNSRPMIKNLYNLQVNDFRSEFGSNVIGICNDFNCYNLMHVKRGSFKYHPVENYNNWRVSILKELLVMRENHLFIHLNQNEINEMITHISCS